MEPEDTSIRDLEILVYEAFSYYCDGHTDTGTDTDTKTQPARHPGAQQTNDTQA
jgi:hypothetical protein